MPGTSVSTAALARAMKSAIPEIATGAGHGDLSPVLEFFQASHSAAPGTAEYDGAFCRVLMDAAQAVLDDNTITSHVKRIRRKFVAIDASFDAIETVYGMGYRWLQ